MKILFVKTVFSPNHHFLTINFNALTNFLDLLEYCNLDSIEPTVLILGYTNSINLINQLLIDRKGKYPIVTNFWSVNYGKYYAFNQINQYLLCNRHDYVFYNDHDIIFDFDNSNLIKQLIECFESGVTINSKKIGAIFLNQKEDCRHQPSIYQNQIRIDQKLYVYPAEADITSVASGCFILKSDILTENEPFELISVYGMDDYYLIKKLSKYCYVVSIDLYCIHPYENTTYYNEWKKNMILTLISCNLKLNYSYLQSVTESHNLWI